ncbi:MAG: SPFH domain-containing protein [Alistipes sp.]|nr:SPFH domain-containing protein [Alistipes sp.]
MEDKNMEQSTIKERKAPASNGIAVLLLILAGFILSTAAFVFGIICLINLKYAAGGILVGAGIIGWITFCILCGGLKNINPNEALVFTLFGSYYGTLKEPGYYFVNPFCTAIHPGTGNAISVNATGENNISFNTFNKKISLKTMTLVNTKQKVNDALGNPVIIGVNVIWHVNDPTMAVLNVENYNKFLSVQCDSVIRNIARLYPYDTMEEDTDEKTLRGSSQEIAETMTAELSEKVMNAGLTIEEVRITNLAYSEEIAAAMLQKQQAVAIIAARQKIVEGAVSMVKMAIDQLGEEDIVVLDEERKAAMVSNLLVVLCGNKDAQPIVNSGSIY